MKKKIEKTTTEDNIEKIDYWLGEISKTNDLSLKITDDLRMILLNLKIVTAWLDKTVGIYPVIDDLERIIISSHDSTKEMVTKGRKELHESWGEIKEELLKECEEEVHNANA